jgi:hypothetical protein
MIRPAAGVIAMSILAVDPLFTYRSREIRYDWFAMIGTMVAWLLVLHAVADVRRERTATPMFIAGVCLAVAVSSHLLYVGAVLVVGVAWLGLSVLQRNQPVQILRSAVGYITGFALGLVPVAVYCVGHTEAVRNQLLYAMLNHHGPRESARLWAKGELMRYLTYYRSTPLLFLVLCVGLAYLLLVVLKDWRDLSAASSSHRPLLIPLAVCCLGLPLWNIIVSGHQAWYQLMVAPFWVLGAAVGLTDLRLVLRSRRPRLVLDAIVAGGLMSALAITLVGRTYVALSTWGERDVTAYYTDIRRVIPNGARVFGDFRLLFLAKELGWHFIARYYDIPCEPEATVGMIRSAACGGELEKQKFDYVVLSELTSKPIWLDLRPYELVATVGASRDATHGRRIGTSALPLCLRIYKARESHKEPARSGD